MAMVDSDSELMKHQPHVSHKSNRELAGTFSKHQSGYVRLLVVTSLEYLIV